MLVIVDAAVVFDADVAVGALAVARFVAFVFAVGAVVDDGVASVVVVVVVVIVVVVVAVAVAVAAIAVAVVHVAVADIVTAVNCCCS